MTKNCPHCDGEIMPSVVKCRHCGKNVNDAPESVADGAGVPSAVGSAVAPPPSGPGAQASGAVTTTVASPPAAPSEAAESPKVAIDDPPPPAGISFTPAVASAPMVVDVEEPSSSALGTDEPAEPEPTALGTDGPAEPEPTASVDQDWGPPTDAGKLDPYWQEKAGADAAVPAGAPVKPPKESAGLLGNVAILFVFLGGVIAAVTSVRPWVHLEVAGIKGVEDSSDLISGTSQWEGRLTLALAVICVVAAFIAFSRRDSAPLKGMIVPGLGILGTVGYTVANLTTQFTDTIVSEGIIKGMSEQAARGQVTIWIDSGQIRLNTEYALYLLAGAGLVVLVGAILAFLARKPVTREVVVTHSGTRVT